MPNEEQDKCIGREVLLYYFIVYVGIALFLAILTWIEKPKDEEDKEFQKVNPTDPSTLTRNLMTTANE